MRLKERWREKVCIIHLRVKVKEKKRRKEFGEGERGAHLFKEEEGRTIGDRVHFLEEKKGCTKQRRRGCT
jgi:hypothetical protein